MARSKNKEPRAWEIVIAAILSAIVGFIGAVAFLVAQPPEEVSELPAEGERELAKVYFVKGESDEVAGAGWQKKEEALKLKRRGEMTLVESEINSWAEVRLGEEQKSAGGGGMLQIEPGLPDFRIGETELFVSIPLEWNVFGFRQTFVTQTSGVFQPKGGVFAFAHDRVYVGSCPLPGFLADRLVADVVASFDVAEEVREGWAALENVEIGEDGLKLVIQ